MKKFFYPLMMFAALATTACTNTQDDITDTTDPSGKTPISFVGEATNAPAKTRAGFDANTKIAMRIKSTNGSSTVYTRAVATANKEKDNVGYSAVNLTEARYWDDAFGRDAQLSVYAIAVPGANADLFENKLSAGTGTWFTESPENETVSWSISTTAQTSATISAEDLTYSNNIQSGGENGVYRYDFDNDKYNTSLTDGCMKFAQKSGAKTEDPGKFDKGHLTFKHALSRITVNLNKGAGFGSNSFAFTSGNNVQILDVPVSGTLDLTNGSWDKQTVTKGNIDNMYLQTTTATSFTLMAQLLPDYEISKTATTTNVLTFVIDNNKYYITQAQMYEALKNASGMTEKNDSRIVMEQGLNYNFNIIVNKTGINDITATVVPFADITAEDITPSNARITISGIYDSNGAASTGFNLYRALDESTDISDNYVGKNWDKGYEGPATLSESSPYTTNWFYESNKAYYHFRTVTGATAVSSTTQDYFVIESGSTDYRWGAPMTSAPAYDVEKGYANQLSPAIGATKSALNITDIHIMSGIEITLNTTTSGAVDLTDSKVYITNFAKDGTVLMGTGKVIPTTTITEKKLINGSGSSFSYYVVPQSLAREAAYVGLIIETKDGNLYRIDNLSTTKVSGSTTETISNWVPGHKYKYSFTLSKTGIESITANVEGWKDITAQDQPVSL